MDCQAMKIHQVALISDPPALSETLAKAVWAWTNGQYQHDNLWVFTSIKLHCLVAGTTGCEKPA